MFLCGKCKGGALWMSGSSLLEHIPEGEEVPADCYIDSDRQFMVKFQFTCEYCGVEYYFHAVDKFKEFE